MQQINLYQEQFRERRDPLDARHLLAALVLLVVVLGAISVWLQQRSAEVSARLAAVERERDGAEQELLELQARVQQREEGREEQSDEITRLRRELNAKREVLAYLETGPLARRDGFSPYLEGLARRVVDDLWFDRIVFERGGAALRFEGHALAPEGVPRMIAALGEETVYAGHAFRTLVIERPEDAAWRVDFVLASDAPGKRKGGGG